VHANQTLILSEATQQVENQVPPAMGRPACAVVPQVMNTGRAALSLGCCGARAYLDVFSDEVAVFAIPGAKLAEYAERIAVLARAMPCLHSFMAFGGNKSKPGRPNRQGFPGRSRRLTAHLPLRRAYSRRTTPPPWRIRLNFARLRETRTRRVNRARRLVAGVDLNHRPLGYEPDRSI